MTKKQRKKIIITFNLILFTILSLLLLSNQVRADIDPTKYDPGTINTSDVKPITDIASLVVNFISVFGVVISVLTLIILGIKYMMGSVEEKADYKKTMIPYLIGAVMIFAITQVLGIIIKIVNNIL